MGTDINSEKEREQKTCYYLIILSSKDIVYIN
jgi:hypothetical protein